MFEPVLSEKSGQERRICIQINYFIFLLFSYVLLLWVLVLFVGFQFMQFDQKLLETFPVVSENLIKSQNVTVPVIRRQLMRCYKK